MSRRSRESSSDVLRKLLKFGKHILTHIGENKFVDGAGAWAYALAAKVVVSGGAVTALIETEHTWDAKIILRSMLDAVIDMFYVLHDPLKEEALVDLLVDEHMEDQRAQTEGYSVYQALPPPKVANAGLNPEQMMVDQARRCQRRDSEQTKARMRRLGLKTRWRAITWKDKVKAIEGFEETHRLLSFGIRTLGDASAHSRPISLEQYVREKRNGSLAMRMRPLRRHRHWRRENVAAEAVILVWCALHRLVNHYYLEQRFETKLHLLIKRLPDAAR